MRARAVIGANFGDEGKGLLVDYLCALQGAGMVVRFNGGAQSGHTVVTPEGKRHEFRHIGAGTFVGVPTFLSQFFICNPIAFFEETDKLFKLGISPPMVYGHPNCLITTFADMIINQRKEDARGDKRHGSVGRGIHETMQRSSLPELKITLSDLWNAVDLRERLTEMCGKYATFRTGKPIEKPDAMIEGFVEQCTRFAACVHPLGIAQCPDPVFEGGQGLLLSQDNKEFGPHLTHSYTGMRNVRILCAQAKITDIDVYYVSRTYLTRHGAGRLPNEDASMRYEDDTNVDHPYQGRLRFAPLDMGYLHDRCRADADGEYKLVLTHADQRPAPTTLADLTAYGPTRKHVE